MHTFVILEKDNIKKRYMNYLFCFWQFYQIGSIEKVHHYMHVHSICFPTVTFWARASFGL